MADGALPQVEYGHGPGGFVGFAMMLHHRNAAYRILCHKHGPLNPRDPETLALIEEEVARLLAARPDIQAAA